MFGVSAELIQLGAEGGGSELILLEFDIFNAATTTTTTPRTKAAPSPV